MLFDIFNIQQKSYSYSPKAKISRSDQSDCMQQPAAAPRGNPSLAARLYLFFGSLPGKVERSIGPEKPIDRC